MIRILITIQIIAAFSVTATAQKSKVLAIFQLIESEKYDEAKIAVEKAIEDESTYRWSKTWQARGQLCQTAYEKGIEKKDKKKYELYPDQLYVAFDSYEKAIMLDKSGRMADQLAPKYVLLANDLLKLGEDHYKNEDYAEALKAFEHVLHINQSPVLSLQPDTNLLYNTALAAYESKEWEKASGYLHQLNEYAYSPNVPHLLAILYLHENDTVSAENVLYSAIDRYEKNEDLVLLLIDLLYQKKEIGKAVSVLDATSAKNDSSYIFPYTKGLVYQKANNYKKAIEAYEAALKLAPDKVEIYENIGTCYYNIGVEIQQNARKLKNNKAFQEEKRRSAAALRISVEWFEKVIEKDTDNQKAATILNQLYKTLQITDRHVRTGQQ
ncbi:MAG: tetratricopeptide repeat protein [Bacteroidales bacterium]|nr:tetratricopeptide repeat protein [Bacteroidales bacterium]